MDWPPRLLIGAAGSGCFAGVAFRLKALTGSGAWAAAVAGTLLFWGGGWMWVVLVGTFFVTSSLLTRWDPGVPGRGVRSLDRSGRRWDQVAANGGVAVLAAVVHAVSGWPPGFAVAAGAIAAATADTWGTEVGRWSPHLPRLVTTWTVVPHGRSGGVTAIGTIGTAAGAFLIAGIAAAIGDGTHSIRFFVTVAGAGFTGALADSVLGATVEERRQWISNSLINLAATGWGAGVVLLVLLATGAWR